VVANVGSGVNLAAGIACRNILARLWDRRGVCWAALP